MGRPPIDATGLPRVVVPGGVAEGVRLPSGLVVNPRHPTEDPEDGCPASWYQSRFVLSLLPYLRRRDDHGGRVANLLLDRCDDEVVIALAQYAEHEQERYEAHRSEVVFGG